MGNVFEQEPGQEKKAEEQEGYLPEKERIQDIGGEIQPSRDKPEIDRSKVDDLIAEIRREEQSEEEREKQVEEIIEKRDEKKKKPYIN